MNKQKLNILLADDDIDDRAFFKSALESIPVETHLSTVSDGDDLMALLGESKGTSV